MGVLRAFRVRLAILAVVVSLMLGGGLWWRHTTQPDYCLRRGQEALRSGDGEQAERLAARLEASGHADHARLLRGEAALRRGDLNGAIRAYNAIGDRDDIAVEASALYGQWFLLQLHRPVEAERFLRYVVSRRPDHKDAHRSLAVLYYDQCAWTATLVHLNGWAELDPQDGRPYRFMGLIYKDLNEPKAAIPAYREALRRVLKPHIAIEVRQELAECLTDQSQYEEALGLLEDCDPEAGEAPRLRAIRAECLWGLGRNTEARSLLTAALDRYPCSVELLRLRARMHLVSHEPLDAVPLLERALAAYPHDHVSRYQLAQAYEALGRPDEAAEQRRQLRRTQDSLKRLTTLVQEAGDRPWDVSLRQQAAELCEELDRPDQARLWRRATAFCQPHRVENDVSQKSFGFNGLGSAR